MTKQPAQRIRIDHPLPPLYDKRSEVLILGSFPSPKTRESGFFYGHTQNRMWPVLARLFDEPVPVTVSRKRDFLLRHHIAMWDVLASCEIVGASDASIAGEVPTDLLPIFEAAPIKAVFCAGGVSAKMYRRYHEKLTGMPCFAMPSTSPANAAWRLDRLVDSWSAVLEYVTEEPTPVLDVAEVVALEKKIAAEGTSLAELMDRAGTWLAYRAHEHDPQARIAVLAGNGNNGGDGWVAARELARWGHEVTLMSAKSPEAIDAQPAHDAALEAARELEKAEAGVLIAPEQSELAEILGSADIIIDALLGTGFAHDSVRAPFDGWIEAANACRERGAYLLSADCPSGLDAQTGRAAMPCIQADETLTMIAPKTGLFLADGATACGTLHVAHICDFAL